MSKPQVKDLQKLINKKWPGAMMTGDDPSLKIERLPTGILTVDYLLGGGFARGRHAEIYGSYSVGKTYLTYRLIASAQQRGLLCSFIDVENTFDPEFAKTTGIDLKSLVLHKQEHGNRVVDFMETLLRAEDFGVIALDSIAALLPKAELESDMEKTSYGTQQARMMSAALRKLTAANKSTVLIYINQTREAIGSMFGPKVAIPGGRAMGFYAGTRLEMVRTEKLKKKVKAVDPKSGEVKDIDSVVGHRVLVRVEKEKTGGAKAGDSTSFVFDYYQKGIDHIEDLIYLGRLMGFIEKKGTTWWVEDYEEEKSVGRKNFKKWLIKNKAVAEELEEWIRDNFTTDLDQEEVEEDE